MKKLVAAALVAAILLPLTASAEKFSFAALGDWPYGDMMFGEKDRLITSINRATPQLAFTVQVGDLHSGSQPCTGAGLDTTDPKYAKSKFAPDYNKAVLGFFNELDTPLIYAIGDNEWADCHKSKQKSSGDPIKELQAVRALFFAKPGMSLGAKPMKVISQAKVHSEKYPDDAKVVENVMFFHKNVLFAAVSVPGGNNTGKWAAPFTNEPARVRETATRQLANLRWLDIAFDAAERSNSKAVVISQQADMWHMADFAESPELISAYSTYVHQLAARATRFGKPVLIINGDRHLYSVDTPLADPSNAFGQVYNTDPVPNLTRLGLQASFNPASWTRVVVDTARSGNAMFSFENVVFCEDKSRPRSTYNAMLPKDDGAVDIGSCSP